MKKTFSIPVMGNLPSLEKTSFEPIYNAPQLEVHSYAPYRRFAVQIVDDGLDSAGLQSGDYAIFREQGWPNNERQVCMIAVGDEVTLRILEGIWDTEPILRVNGDKIPPISPHRNDFIVLGVLDGIIKSELAVLTEPIPEEFDWGC